MPADLPIDMPFKASRRRAAVALFSAVALGLTLASCGGGGGGGGGGGFVPTPTPTPRVTPTPGVQSLLCTTSGAAQSIARQSVEPNVPKRIMGRASGGFAPGRLEVTFARSAFAQMKAQAHAAYGRVGAQPEGTLDFPSTDRTTEVVSVAPGSEQSAMNALRAQPGVQSVTRVAYRSALSTTAVLTNDRYFRGFGAAAVPPLYESATSPGQYDMHIICAANAWGYGNTNSTGVTHAGALGGTAKIAIIDTGADLTHPDLAGRAVYGESDINGVTTVGLAGMHDNDGHGTDVAGIAAATGNNTIGFAGVAYAAPLMIFRVFPDPPAGGCPPGSSNSQCQALSTDIALAINHAVAQGAKVINLSLGASSADPTEENAVASAIAAGVVVVAASGNETASSLDYPAADPGVIAVGASSIDDSNPLSITEKVASYSNYSAANPTTWGLVAPGGDPTGSSDNDDLHWIENLYTSSASDSSNFCSADFGAPGTTSDCRVLIAGTSQAAPHVAGAVALLLSVGGSAANIKNVLCSTANAVSGAKAGCGRLNVYRAMAQVVGDPSP